MKRSALRSIVFTIVVFIFSGCTVKYTINDPVVTGYKYDSGDNKKIVMKIEDARSDREFHLMTAGIALAKVPSSRIQLVNMEDPIAWLSQSLKKEFEARGIPMEIVDQTSNTHAEIVLYINKYQIVSRRLTGFSPWISTHSFMGELKTADKTCEIPSFFYGGKVPVWSMGEIEEPCYNIPVSVMVKEIASKINRCALNYSLSDNKLEQLRNSTVQAVDSNAGDAYLSVLGLGSSNNPKAMDALVKFSDSKDDLIRSAALSSMGTLGAQNELGFLKEKYRQYNDREKFMALKSIGDIGSPESVEFMKQVKMSPEYKDDKEIKSCVDLFLGEK